MSCFLAIVIICFDQSKKFININRLEKIRGGSPEGGEATPNYRRKIQREYKKNKIGI